MMRIGICGNFGNSLFLANGQVIKTNILAKELRKVFGEDTIKIVNTYNWRHNLLKLIANCVLLLIKCKNIIILPAQNGLIILLPLYVILNKIFRRRIHYVVIGGWLPDFVTKRKLLKKFLFCLDGIYVETYSMVNTLESMGFKNIFYLPNFKELKILDEKDLVYCNKEPYKLCTFSRVSKEKGIEIAIEAVKYVNEKLGYNAYTLDIYGQIEEQYQDRFNELRKNFPSYISYKGIVDYQKSVDILKNYFALLFPTYYKGEGFPGTIIDTFAAGIPVIASDWKYNKEIIDENTGIIYSPNNEKALADILISIIENPEKIFNKKRNCIKKAHNYSPEIVLNELIKRL